MRSITIIALLFFLFACSDKDHMAVEQLAGKFCYAAGEDLTFEYLDDSEWVHAYEMFSNGYYIDDFYILDTSKRENVFMDHVPDAVKDFAHEQGFICPDTTSGCAGCWYCGFTKLADDWNYFAFEQSETKHYNQVRIFKKKGQTYEPVDTLYGITINAQPTTGNSVYRITLLEDYWRDHRPRNIETWEMEGSQFVMTGSVPGTWRKSDTAIAAE